jgi:hypothetical protein
MAANLSLDVLAQRLTRLEDERDILAILYRYGHTIDHGPDEDWLDCFTDDGVWESVPAPGLSSNPRRIVARGTEELRAFIAAHTHAPVRWHKHLLSEPMIQLDGDEARVVSYWVRIDRYEEGIYTRGFGRYRDHLVRCPDGRWRFRERIIDCEGMELRGDAVPPATTRQR